MVMFTNHIHSDLLLLIFLVGLLLTKMNTIIIPAYICQVVFSVMCYRTLRQPPNLLLLALAVTDLFVSLLVMPGKKDKC